MQLIPIPLRERLSHRKSHRSVPLTVPLPVWFRLRRLREYQGQFDFDRHLRQRFSAFY